MAKRLSITADADKAYTAIIRG